MDGYICSVFLMSRFLKNSMLVLLSGLFLFSVSGVNIYMHHCSCKDLQYVTATPSASCCTHDETMTGCCGTGPTDHTSCCTSTENSCTGSIRFKTSDCCTTEHLFIRLDTDLDRQIKQDPVLHYALLSDDIDSNESSLILNSGQPYQYDAPPGTHISGKDLLNLLHQRRIDC